MTLSGLGGVQEFGCATKFRIVAPHQRTCSRGGSSGWQWWHGGLMEATRSLTALDRGRQNRQSVRLKR
jgi:hypothetical protein